MYLELRKQTLGAVWISRVQNKQGLPCFAEKCSDTSIDSEFWRLHDTES